MYSSKLFCTFLLLFHPSFVRAYVNLDFVLRAVHLGLGSNPGHVRKSIERTLSMMAAGGIYDHVAGGFHRYSVDREWHVPHFEKMLYDQGQLAVTYTEAFQLTRNPTYRNVAEGILRYVQAELRHPDGGFYCGEDADSLEGDAKVEGAFYAWTYDEFVQVVKSPTVPSTVSDVDIAAVAARYFDVRPEGNVQARSDPHGELSGKNVLTTCSVEAGGSRLAETANAFELTPKQVDACVAAATEALHAVRQKRPRPHLDTKILAGWNGLMISGLSKAGAAFGDPNLIAVAAQCADFLRKHLYKEEGKLLLRCCYADTGEARNNVVQIAQPVAGFAEDYAFLTQGLLDLYEAGGEERWLAWAVALQTALDQRFWDADHGAYYQAEADPSILLRLKDDQDGAEPSANSVAARNLVRLSRLLDRPGLEERATTVLKYFARILDKYPIVLPKLLSAGLLLEQPAVQIVIVSPPQSDPSPLLAEVNAKFLPWKSLVHLGPLTDSYVRSEVSHYAELSPVHNAPTAFVCQNFACSLPVTKAEDLAPLLK